MCFCCCTTRKAILIYVIVISSFAFIYGIVAISKFGSNTPIYKYLMEKLKSLEEQKNSGSYSPNGQNNYDDDYNYYKNYPYKIKNDRRMDNNDPYNIYGTYYYNNAKYAQSLLNSASFAAISSLSVSDINNKGYGLIKKLKGIENGLGIILFIFPIIFLAAEILFIIFTCGIKENQVLKTNVFNILNILKLICITISTILIFLSVLYAILLIVVMAQYLSLVGIIDSCLVGVIRGMVYGYYGVWYYIILSCAFCNERARFIKVWTDISPGPEAQYDLNGNNIRGNAVIINNPIIIGGQTTQAPTGVLQLGNQNNNQNNLNNNGYRSGDEYVNINGIIYRRVDAIDNNKNNNTHEENNNNISIFRNPKKKNSTKRQSTSKRRNSKSKTNDIHKVKEEYLHESINSDVKIK